MKWVLIIWLVTPDNYTIYQKFNTENECIEKKELVSRALRQADSKMQLICRQVKPRDHFAKSDIVINRYVIR